MMKTIFVAVAALGIALPAYAGGDTRTAAQKAFCAGLEMQRMATEANATLLRTRLGAVPKSAPFAGFYSPKVIGNLLGVPGRFGTFRCSPTDVQFAP